MATHTRRRTISPGTRASGSNRYKVNTKNVLTGDTLVVEIDHATKPFQKQFTFSGRDVGKKNSISFSADERGNTIDITWSGATPSRQSMAVAHKEIQSDVRNESKVAVTGENTVQSLKPVVDEHTKVMILGTMPGVESLKQQAYYSHPRNLVWRLIAEITGTEVPDEYSDREMYLLEHNIGLWDMCQSCIREGSLDQNISGESPNDLKGLIAEYPNITCFAFNGQKAKKLFNKHFGSIPNIEVLALPSTSPANTGLSWEEKKEKWKKIKTHLK